MASSKVEVTHQREEDKYMSDSEFSLDQAPTGKNNSLDMDLSENPEVSEETDSKHGWTRVMPKHDHGDAGNSVDVEDEKSSFFGKTKDRVVHEALNNSVENIMKFAEILYKCTLCTSLPSILTSKDSFICHVNEEHFTKSKMSKVCSFCDLTFGTDEDLTAHVEFAHICDHDEIRSEKSTSSESFDGNEIQMENLNFWLKLQNLKQKDVNKVGEGDMDKDPKFNIVHGQENMSQISNGEENLTRLHELTDQIMAVQAKENMNSSGNRTPRFGIAMMPSYTAEFGKFTKLVREGGNIVYFCQVCNWKSQIKVQFQCHCQSRGHLVKVRLAGQKNSDKTENTKGEIQNSADPKLKGGKESVSCMTKVNSLGNMEPSGSPVCLSKGKENTLTKDPSKVPHVSDENDSDFSQVCKNPSEKSSKGMVRQHNKRKRLSATTIRNHIHDTDRWDTSDSDENFVCPSDLSKSPMKSIQGKRKFTEGSPTLSEGELSILSSIKKEKSISPSAPSIVSPKQKIPETSDSAIWQSPKITNQLFPFSNSKRQMIPKSNGSVFPEFVPQLSMPPECGIHLHENQMLLQRQSENSDYNKMQKFSPLQLGERKLNFSEQNSQILLESKSVYSSPDSILSRVQQNYFRGADLSHFVYRCSLCRFGCDDLSEYKTHFEVEHEQIHDEQCDPSATEGKGESWKMLKIKESLPDLICSFPRGNVSRDLLLQKISQILHFPEVVQWGPACNKAVRELFPVSLAQRKGKHKKTYFFGVSFIEQLQEPEEPQVSDSEAVQYQPLRDMSQDMEKILEHLHVFVEWKGDMEYGISRDEVLQLLHLRIDEPDVQHWGMQCNRAIRYLFPHVQIKRKGKYKTTIFFGVDFKKDVQDLLRSSPGSQVSPNKRGRPKKALGNDLQYPKAMSWTDAIRTGHSDSYKLYSNLHVPNTVHSSADVPMVTRGWGPSFGWHDSPKVSHAEGSSENLDTFPKDLTLAKQGNRRFHGHSDNTEGINAESVLIHDFEKKEQMKDRSTNMNSLRTGNMGDSGDDGIDPKFLYKYGPWCEEDNEEENNKNRQTMFAVNKKLTDDDIDDDDADDEGSDAEDERQQKDVNDANLQEVQPHPLKNSQQENAKDNDERDTDGFKRVYETKLNIKIENESV